MSRACLKHLAWKPFNRLWSATVRLAAASLYSSLLSTTLRPCATSATKNGPKLYEGLQSQTLLYRCGGPTQKRSAHLVLEACPSTLSRWRCVVALRRLQELCNCSSPGAIEILCCGVPAHTSYLQLRLPAEISASGQTRPQQKRFIGIC